MATQFKMINPKTGEMKTAFYGYSWATLFWGVLPALFRKDFHTSLIFLAIIFFDHYVNISWSLVGFIINQVIVAISRVLPGISSWSASWTMYLLVSLAWSFMDNKYYSINLLKQGFVFSGSDEENKVAAAKLGVVLNEHNTMPATPDAANI